MVLPWVHLLPDTGCGDSSNVGLLQPPGSRHGQTDPGFQSCSCMGAPCGDERRWGGHHHRHAIRGPCRLGGAGRHAGRRQFAAKCHIMDRFIPLIAPFTGLLSVGVIAGG